MSTPHRGRDDRGCSSNNNNNNNNKKVTSSCDSCDLLRRELENARRAQGRADEVIRDLIDTNRNLASAVRHLSDLLEKAHQVLPPTAAAPAASTTISHTSPYMSLDEITTTTTTVTTTTTNTDNTSNSLTVAQIIAPWSATAAAVEIEPLPAMVTPMSPLSPATQSIHSIHSMSTISFHPEAHIAAQPHSTSVPPPPKPGYQCILCGKFYTSHHTTRHYRATHSNYLGGQLSAHLHYPDAFHFKTKIINVVCPPSLRPKHDQVRGVHGVNWRWLNYPEAPEESDSDDSTSTSTSTST